jgi:hypothetical protein
MNGGSILMQISCEEWEILSTHEIIKHLVNSGFKNINEFSLFENGKPYCRSSKEICVEFKQENYEKLALNSEENIIAVTRLIAEFHKLAKGFNKPNGVRIKTEWGRLIEKYKMMVVKLNKYYIKIDESKEKNNAFAVKTMECKKDILNWAEAANKVFNSDLYISLLENSMREKEIGLVSFNDDTVIKADNQLKLSGIFDVSYNMAIEDVGKLIRKCCMRTENCINEDLIIREYEKIHPLDQNEIIMIHAITDFPYDCIKIILKYQEDNSKEKQLLEKFIRVYEKESISKAWRANQYGL